MPSPNQSASRSGGRILVDALCVQEVKHVFCVPGESYLAALDALQDASGSTPIELFTNVEAIAHTATLSEIRARSMPRPGGPASGTPR